MFNFIKNLFLKSDDRLVNNFIKHMKKYNINLKKKSDGLLICMDFPFGKEFEHIEYMIRNSKIIINYNKSPTYTLRTFFPYYRIVYNFESGSTENCIENLYLKIINGIDFDNENHGKIVFNTYLEPNIESFSYYIKYKTSIYKKEYDYKLSDFFARFFFPSISYENGKLSKNLVLLFCLKESPYEYIYGSFKDVIINIEELKETFELNVYCHTYGLEIDSISIKKDSSVDEIARRILLVIKALSISKKNYDLLDIQDWKEFTQEHYEALKLLTY